MEDNRLPMKKPLGADEALTQPVASDDAETIKLYEERMIADKNRTKTGEVAVDKHTESETARVSMPIEKEHIVIERGSKSVEAVDPDNIDAFNDNETVRMEVYEETPDIHKEAFVREEVSIRKEVTQETVKGEENLRREELDVDTQGNPVIDNSSNQGKKPRRQRFTTGCNVAFYIAISQSEFEEED